MHIQATPESFYSRLGGVHRLGMKSVDVAAAVDVDVVVPPNRFAFTVGVTNCAL